MSSGLNCFLGTHVALTGIAMRMIDILVIYLAIGAPVGAAAFLRDRTGSETAIRTTFGFFWAMVLWPFYVLFELWGVGRPKKNITNTPADRRSLKPRAVQSALAEIDKVLFVFRYGQSEALAEKSADLMESIAKYLELTSAVAAFERNERPAQQEIEFYRAAQTGPNSVELSASCLHRRNLGRIHQHWLRSRQELMFALRTFTNVVASSGTLSDRHSKLSQCIVVESKLLEVADHLSDRDLAVEVAGAVDSSFIRLRQLEEAKLRERRIESTSQQEVDPNDEALVRTHV